MGDTFHAECLLLIFFLPWVKNDPNETDIEYTQLGFESERRARGAIFIWTHAHASQACCCSEWWVLKLGELRFNLAACQNVLFGCVHA